MPTVTKPRLKNPAPKAAAKPAKPVVKPKAPVKSEPKDKVELSKESKDSSSGVSGLSKALKENLSDKEKSKDDRSALVLKEKLDSVQKLEELRKKIEAGENPEILDQHHEVDAETEKELEKLRELRDQKLQTPKAHLKEIEAKYQVDKAVASTDLDSRARKAVEKIAQGPEGTQTLADMDSLYQLEQQLQSEKFQGNKSEAQAKAKELRQRLSDRGVKYPTDEQLEKHQDAWNRYYSQKNSPYSSSDPKEPWASPELSYIHARQRADRSEDTHRKSNLARVEAYRNQSVARENGIINRINGDFDSKAESEVRRGEQKKNIATRRALRGVDRQLTEARKVSPSDMPDHLRNSEAIKNAPEGTEFSLNSRGELVGTRYGREVARATTDGQSVEVNSGKTETLLTRTRDGWDEDSETTGYNGDFRSYVREGNEEWRDSKEGDTTRFSYRRDGQELERSEVRTEYGREVYRQDFAVKENGQEVTETHQNDYLNQSENHKVDTKYPDGTRLIKESDRFKTRTTDSTTLVRGDHSYRSETESHRSGSRGSSTTRRFKDGELLEENREISWRVFDNPHQMVPDTIANNSPQDMMERLGTARDIQAERVVQSGKSGDRTFNRFTNKDGTRQLTYADNPDGIPVVEYSEKTDTGSRSQTFFQGTKDYITSETKQDGKWEVTKTEEHFKELSKSNDQLKEWQRSTSRATDKGTAADLQATLTKDLSNVRESDAWKAFQSAAKLGDLKIVSSEVENSGGTARQIIAEAPNGRRFIAVRQPDGSLITRTEDTDGRHLDSVTDKQGKFHSRGGVEGFDLQDAQRVSGMSKSLSGPRNPKVRFSTLHGMDATFHGASAVLNGIGLAADMENFDKNPEPAIRRAASLGMDIKDLADSYSKSVQAAKISSHGSKLARGLTSVGRFAGAATRALGRISGAVSAGFVVKDLADGNYVEAGIGGLSTAAFIAGGPVGWALGGIAFTASLVWESDKLDQIADAKF